VRVRLHAHTVNWSSHEWFLDIRYGLFIILILGHRGASSTTVAAKIAALANAVTKDDLQAMRPVERRRFAELCRHLADLADPKTEAPKSGVLADLRKGHRGE